LEDEKGGKEKRMADRLKFKKGIEEVKATRPP
jgi:hypothetical protein